MPTFKEWRYGKNRVKYAFFADEIADAQIDAAKKKVLTRWANHTLTRTAPDLTPKDLGNLRGSFTHEIRGDFKRVYVRLLNTASYAYYVHERNLSYKVGAWKYLTRAVDKDLPSLMGWLRTSYFETANRFRKYRKPPKL